MYLIEIDTHLSYEHAIGFETFFPGKKEVFADWFTGDLRLPDGEDLEYIHHGYGGDHERDIIISMEAGNVTSTKVIDNLPEFERREKQAEDLKERIAKMKLEKQKQKIWYKLFRLKL